MVDGDERHSEFIFTRFVLVGAFPACIGFIGFVIKLQSGVPFHTGGHRATRIFYSDTSQSFMLTPRSD